MKRAIVLQHLDREGPGTIAEICTQRGIEVDIRRLDLGVPVPTYLPLGDLLVVMGGPMGIADLDSPLFPFLAREVELLRKLLGQKQRVLGVCLGAQLLAYAAGSQVAPNQRQDANGCSHPVREVGFGTVRLLGTQNEAVLTGLPSHIPVLHWHSDTFDLPQGAVHLAESDACSNQAFRIGRHAFGLQFHIETDADLVRTWARMDSDFVESALGPEGAASIIEKSDLAARELRIVAEKLIGNILDEMLLA